MTTAGLPRRGIYQGVAIVASCLGLLTACGFERTVPPPFPPPPPPMGISISSSVLRFAKTEVGSASAPQTVTLTNAGEMPVAIPDVLLVGAGSKSFGKGTTCPAVLDGRQSCKVVVIFHPTHSGLNGAVVVIKAAYEASQAISISGVGTPSTSTAP